MSDSDTAVPLWAPDHTIRLGGAVARFWRKYVDFTGRATRAEYWWSFLFVGLGFVVSLTALYVPLLIWEASDEQGPPLFAIGVALTVGWFLATVLPWLALEARRLHDANLSGFFLFLHLATWFGSLAVFIMCQLSPNPLGRRYDAPPGEPSRHNRVGDWPAAPGEPAHPYAVRIYDAPGAPAAAAGERPAPREDGAPGF